MAHDVQAAPRTAVGAFGDRLAEAIERKRSQLAVGLDPRLDLLPVELRGDPPAEAVARFSRGIIDAVAPHAVAIKPQLAFFEALGPDGMRALEEVCAYARSAGLLVIADGKRGDIGSTARAYAAAYLEPRGGADPVADALTVNPYLGRDSLEPFLAARAPRTSRISPFATGSSSGSTLRGSWASGVRTSSASVVCRASAPSWARLTRAQLERRAGSCPARSCCCRESARRARLRATSRVPSRADLRARS